MRHPDLGLDVSEEAKTIWSMWNKYWESDELPKESVAPGQSAVYEPSLLYQIYKSDYAMNTRADATIHVPLEIYDDYTAVSELLQELQLSSETGDSQEKYEVLIGINSESLWDMSSDLKKFREITLGITETFGGSETVTWYAFLSGLRDRNMNRVMRRMTLKTAGLSRSLNRSLNYPILRFDGDMDSVEGIDNLTQAVRSGEAHLVKLHTSFIPPYAKRRGEHPDEARSYERIAIFYGLAKSMIESTLGPYEERIYHEESGSGMQLGSLLRVQTVANNNPERYGSNGRDGENKVFLSIAKEILDPNIPLFKYIDSTAATHTTSVRRIEHLAQTRCPQDIPLQEYGDNYKTYVELAKEPISKGEYRQETPEEVMAMIGIIVLRQEAACGRPVDFRKEDAAELQRRLHAHYYAAQPELPYDNWVGEARRLGAAYMRAINVAA